MPFVQVSLVRGQSPQTLASITESIHSALVEEFKIPEPDRFQVVREVDASHLIFPPSFLGIEHSENIIYIHITTKEGRTVEMKQRLYEKIASLIHGRTGISVDDVIIVLAENKAENWSLVGGRHNSWQMTNH